MNIENVKRLIEFLKTDEWARDNFEMGGRSFDPDGNPLDILSHACLMNVADGRFVSLPPEKMVTWIPADSHIYWLNTEYDEESPSWDNAWDAESVAADFLGLQWHDFHDLFYVWCVNGDERDQVTLSDMINQLQFMVDNRCVDTLLYSELRQENK